MKSKRLLVIDDDMHTRRILEKVLMAEGYDVITASDGYDGLLKTRVDRPALVITDILMPRMDGFQYLSEIRKIEDFRTLPIIFYTGNYLDREDEDLARRLGVSKFLLKPLAPIDVISAVKELMGERTASSGPTPPMTLEEPALMRLYNERLVSKLKHKVAESENTRQTLEHILDDLGDGIMLIDADYTVIQVNAALASSLRRDKAEILGKKCYEVTHNRSSPCSGTNFACPYQMVFERGESLAKVLHTHIDAEGNEKQIDITATPVKDSRGRIIAMVETSRDLMDKVSDDELVKLIKKLNETQSHLKHMTITDDLTGLRNRRYIMERLEEEYQRAKRSGQKLSLIMLDIDRFKLINDSHGHPFGDLVLRNVASRIKTVLRKHDIVGRVGGEEFLVLCPNSSLEDTVNVAERIRTVVYEQPIGDGIREVVVAMSAGVTSFNEDDESSDRTFSRADAALYKAKGAGRNRVEIM